MNSLRPASRLPEGPRQAPLAFPPLWSVPDRGNRTVSPHSNPRQPPAPVVSSSPPCPVVGHLSPPPPLCDFLELPGGGPRQDPAAATGIGEPTASLLAFLAFVSLCLLSFLSRRGFSDWMHVHRIMPLGGCWVGWSKGPDRWGLAWACVLTVTPHQPLPLPSPLEASCLIGEMPPGCTKICSHLLLDWP